MKWYYYVAIGLGAYLLWRMWTRKKAVIQTASQDAGTIAAVTAIAEASGFSGPGYTDKGFVAADQEQYPGWYKSPDGVMWVNPDTGEVVVGGTPPAWGPVAPLPVIDLNNVPRIDPGPPLPDGYVIL